MSLGLDQPVVAADELFAVARPSQLNGGVVGRPRSARRTLASLLAFATLTCAHLPALNKDAKDVIETVCQGILLHAIEAPAGTYLLIESRTRSFEVGEGELSMATESGIPPLLMQQLVSERSREVALSTGAAALRPVTTEEIQRIFADGPSWDRFYARFPGSRGFVELSGPVFSSDGKQALLYVDYSCYGDCGWGSVIHLELREHGWVEIHEWVRYMS